MKLAVVGNYHSAFGQRTVTHVRVEIYQVLSAYLRRSIDAYDISFAGAPDSADQLKQSVAAELARHGIIGETDTVITDAEMRNMGAN